MSHTTLTDETIRAVIRKAAVEAQRAVVTPTSLDQVEVRGLYASEPVEKPLRMQLRKSKQSKKP